MNRLTDEQRSNVVAMCEGHALQHCNQGADFAADFARCHIDGNFNALLRLEGPEAAAQYAFALADRVVGRIKAPTPWQPMRVAPPPTPPANPEPAPVSAEPQSSKPMRSWAIFAVGLACGFAMGIGVHR